MKSRIVLGTALVAAAAGLVAGVRYERTRQMAERAYRRSTALTRAQATATAERLDAVIREIETSERAETGTDWRYQTLVGARDALVALGGEAAEADPGVPSDNGSAGA
jgi:hypothetical protein